MKVENENYLLEISNSEYCENPRIEFDNLSKMVCFHKRYNLGDNGHGYNQNDYNSFEELKKAILKEDVAIIFPLYMYEHGGITISLTSFNDRWDSGQIGFVYITKQALRYGLGCKRLSKKKVMRGINILDNEVELYKLYLEGEIYQYRLTDKKTGDVDSCGGFYGSDINENGMLEYLPKEFVNEFKTELGIK